MLKEKIVNQYEYSESIIKESINSWWNIKFKWCYLIVLVLIITMLTLFIITKKIQWILLFFFSFLPLILLYFKKSNAVKIEKEKLNTIYKNKPLIIKVVIDNDIKTITSKGEKCVIFKEIEYYVETKNLIVLIIKGNMTIAIDKKGFIEGNYNSLIELLKQNNVINKKIL